MLDVKETLRGLKAIESNWNGKPDEHGNDTEKGILDLIIERYSMLLRREEEALQHVLRADEGNLQIITADKKAYNLQRVAIYHNGNNMMDTYSGRVITVDGRTVYKEKRFSQYGKEAGEKFAKRCGFEDIRSFFNHYYQLTNGEPFFGVIEHADGFRWFDMENSYSV